MNDHRHLRRLRVAAPVAVLALLAGCGSSTSSSAPVAAGASGSTGAASPTDTSSPADSITPSSNVGTTVSLTDWVSAVCTHARQFQQDSVGAATAATGKDPGSKLVATFSRLGTELKSFAADLEQLGAPDVANGKQFTDEWVDAANALADVYTGAAGGVPANASTQQALAAYEKAFDTAKAKAATKELEAAGNLLDTKTMDAIAKSTPQCKGLDFSSGG